MNKEFGKLSIQQIKEFYELFCKLLDNLSEDLDNLSLAKPLTDRYPVWHPIYELELNVVTVHLLKLIGMEQELLAAIQSDDPQQHFLNLMKTGYEAPVELESLDTQQLINLLSCIMCMCGHFLCFAAYRTDIYKLLNEANEGHKESLFKAINIDQSVVSTQTASL